MGDRQHPAQAHAGLFDNLGRDGHGRRQRFEVTRDFFERVEFHIRAFIARARALSGGLN